MDDKIKKAEEWYDKNVNIYKQFSYDVSQIIEKIIRAEGILYHSITHRVKEKDSYLEKCKKEKYLNPVEEIMDVAGIRIIAYTNSDVEKMCGLIKQEFKIDIDNSGNKIDKMDEDKVGYLSVHYIAQLNDIRLKLKEYMFYTYCKCEIQIRTFLQHAWAEIEHDRNYKFSGVLPKNIKRRFYLTAAVLELVDKEFDTLSNEIDNYSKMVQEKTKEGDFDIDIDTESLSQYMLLKFKDDFRVIKPDITLGKSEIEELNRFGFTKIKDIDQNLTDEIVNKILMCGYITYVGILRNLMMLLDVKKYFENAYNKTWASATNQDLNHWEKMGIKDIRKYLETENIEII